MTDFPDFPALDSPAKCAALWTRYPEKVVGMWATGLPRQNVDVLWRLRQELLKLGVPVVFFFRESAGSMLHKVINDPHSETEDIFQLDDAKFFRLLNFVDVLVTNDYQLGCKEASHIRAKLVGMPHHANVANPTFWNHFFDYFVSDRNDLRDFDYSFYPDRGKIHRNSHFTQLVVGHPKIDLILEERQKNASCEMPPVLLLYPAYVDFSIKLQNISPERYVEIWSEAASEFLKLHPEGLVVFRPIASDRCHPLVERLRARFAEDGRFFIDDEDDNKFWLARAQYFVTDYSEGFINFCMTAGKPAIRMVHTPDSTEPALDEWGWIIRTPSQLPSVLHQMRLEEKQWAQALFEKRQRDMPTLGRNFIILADMIMRIFNNQDPGGLLLTKGHTPCDTPTHMLKLVAKWVKRSPLPHAEYLTYWLDNELIPTGCQNNPKMWLLLLRRALLPFAGDSPAEVAQNVDVWLGNALNYLPLRQSVGLMRHLLRKHTHDSALALLMTATSAQIPGPHKKRALFFLLMELPRHDVEALLKINEQAETMPQHFSRPVLAKLNRFLPIAMKVPLPLRRLGALVLSLKKPLAKKYWQAHCDLA